ncbi:hypothetical protein [Streptomyces sp. NPDC048419]|uniref:hypothetical protein n=1 Tax=Streptomyces sp. NPDC048419 TaxID=3365547 RepID=UPI003721EEC6
MKHRTSPAAVALAATAAVLLTACGGGSDNSKNDAKTAVSKPKSETSASPRAKTSSSTDRPAITFPSDAKNVFDDRKTDDKTKAAILADSALSINAVDEAIFKGSTGTKALGFYNTGKALNSSITYVQGYIDDADTWIGETRYFDRRVTLSGADKAYVTYCSDESKSFIKNKKTHKVDRTPTTANSYVLYHTVLNRSAEGTWQTTDIVSNRGDKACQP